MDSRFWKCYEKNKTISKITCENDFRGNTELEIESLGEASSSDYFKLYKNYKLKLFKEINLLDGPIFRTLSARTALYLVRLRSLPAKT